MGGAAGGGWILVGYGGDRAGGGGAWAYQQMQLVEQQVCLLSLYLARSYVLGLGYLHRVDRVENHCEA